MGKVVGLAFVAALNPALLAATTIMLLLPRPKAVDGWLLVRRNGDSRHARSGDRLQPEGVGV